jgi:oxygen-independent coproporphyrinogen-3 oxidase
MYALTQEVCDAAGMPAYEVSNHARPGSESRHNLIYWRGGDYVGIGPGAHGRMTLDGTRWATEAPKAPGAWLALVEAGKAGERPRTALSTMDRAEEYLLMSLRLVEGMEISRYETMADRPLDRVRLADLDALGLARAVGDRVQVTAAGRMVLNAIIRDLAGE